MEDVKDFIYRRIKPIVLENFDCSKGRYEDIYGNYISQSNLKIKKVIFRGYNNRLEISENILGMQNVEIDVCANTSIIIREGTRFNSKIRILMEGYSGGSKIYIGKSCRFDETFFRVINHPHPTNITINDNSTFEKNVEFRANSGKGIIIGKDCMFSRDIQLQSGDGHSIFNVNTKKNINSNFVESDYRKNNIMICDHVWVSASAFIFCISASCSNSYFAASAAF